MYKDIKYNGYTAQPADNQSPDGDLALSLNLINEDGYIVPIRQPQPTVQLTEDEHAVFIHKTPTADNLITYEIDDRLYLYYTPYSQGETTAGMRTEIDVNIPDCHQITAIGDTLIIATSAGLYYILWRDNDYIPLGHRPPFTPIEFTLLHDKNYGDAKDIIVPENCWNNTGNPDGIAFKKGKLNTETLKADYAAFTQSVYAIINSLVHENITSKGLFYQPFFIRYAFRLYDGSYSWHSAPVLMLPTVLPPMITYNSLVGNYTDSESNVRLTPSIPAFKLLYRNLLSSIERLFDWSDIITGVDFFVSAPVYTYNQSADIADQPNVSRLSVIEKLCSTRNTHEPESQSDCFFIGNYGTSSNTFGPQFLTRSSITGDHLVNIPRPENFFTQLAETSLFYKIASVELKNLATGTSFKELPLLQSDLSNLVTFSTLPDDYLSHARFIPASLYAYNSRLSYIPQRYFPPEPFSIRTLIPFSGNPAITNTSLMSRVQITVISRYNDSRCLSTRTSELPEDFAQNLYDFIPSYIFIPDPNASQIVISIFPPGSDDIGEAEHLYLKLTQHALLNGAYYLNRSFVKRQDGQDIFDSPVSTSGLPASVAISSKILTSEVANPFVFPATGFVTIGNGQVLGLATAARALSQGQFGQYPLYAFTTEGVWALEVSPTGAYSARQPITRDVCISPQSITPIDSAVIFASDRGIMLLSGSQSQCISDPINTDHPFIHSKLPGLTKISSLITPTSYLKPFSAFLRDGAMLYDYRHQRILLYNSDNDFDYAYVFSLKSKLWALTNTKIRYSLNAYPEALAVNDSSMVVNFSNSTSDILPGTSSLITTTSHFSSPGLLITRPLKLDAANIHKTIDNIIQRGNFAKGHVRSVLYGSRDLINWHLVWSSKDHFLRGFRGTPYKYFRVALLCSLSPGESIYGASVQFTPRLTNQPR